MMKKIFQLILAILFVMPGVMKAQTVEIESVTVPPGDILVQVDMLGFPVNSNVAAITLIIEYESDLLEFLSIENIHASFTGTWVANYSSGTDQLVITYTAPVGVGHDFNGKLLDIKFNYLGGFSTPVSFAGGCEIANSSLHIILATYVDGSVTQSAAVGTVSMDDLTEPIGNTVNMPVTILGAGFGTVDAITLKVAYDETQLVYVGIVENAITGVVPNATGGVLTLIWTGTAINFTTLATLLNIQFVYHGGNADVEFIPGCEISGGLTLLATEYVNGSVEPTPQSASLTIQSVGGTAGNPVNVPIVAYDIIQTVGSIDLNISYENSKLIYTGYSADQLSNWLVNGNVPGVITITWSNSGGVIIADGNLITLNFSYSGGVALIEFDPGCELKTNNLVTIPVTFNNGLVSDLSVSGVLKYANTGAVRPLASSTVYLKSSDGTTTIATTTTDASGNYEFTGVAPGSYLLDASTTIAWGGLTLADYAIIRAFVTTGSPVLSGIYWDAADVNDSGTVTLADYAIVRNRVTTGSFAGWRTERWLFEDVSITVTGSSLAGEDILSICVGDVNATYNLP